MRLALLVVPIVLCVGCTTRPSLYDRMNAAVEPGEGFQQTQLAHIGHVDTAEGRYEVAVQRLVLTGMLAPRGQRNLRLFTKGGYLVATYSLSNAEPLWCEGGKLYLFGFGYIAGVPVDSQIASRFADDELPTGNVVDFSQGIAKAVLKRETRYGSSGGIEDVAAVRPRE
jgi:hypothetical protein